MTPPANMGRMALTLGVIVCTYRRPNDLLKCLGGLALQERPADDVILVVRPTDAATHAALAAHPPATPNWRIVAVETPGLVAARNAGLAACTCDIVTFCDDDTIAASDWVARIAAHFAADPSLGGLGGRDRCHDATGFDDRRSRTVGQVQWFGRPVGNHHRGYGEVRDVQFLKGANMSFRSEALRGLRFDERLRGVGTQPHDDFNFSLAVGRTGWRQRYDPAVVVDHYPGVRDEPRSYVAKAGLDDPLGYYDASYNLTLALQQFLSGHRRWLWRLWALLVGMRAYPGLVQLVRLLPREGRTAWQKFIICQRASSAARSLLTAHSEQKPSLRVQRTG